jgi:vancomycin resistance protein YoaR
MGVVIVVGVAMTASGALALYFEDRILPNTFVGTIPVGGLARDDADQRIEEGAKVFEQIGIRLAIQDSAEPIRTESIGFDVDVAGAVDEAFKRGHTGSMIAQIGERMSSLWREHDLIAPVVYDEKALTSQIGDIAELVGIPRRDIRLETRGTVVTLATDTASGRAIDQEEAFLKVTHALRALDASPIELQLYDDPPRADQVVARAAVVDAQKMLARPIVLSYEDLQYYISRERIASWLVSDYEQDQLRAGVNEEMISAYVTTVADALNIPPVPAHITTEAGRVTGFTPPKVGRAVQEEKLVELIISTLKSRTTTKPTADTFVVPLKSTNIALTGLDSGSGITELIGKATTPFTGSPRNRISNIKNGVKFLTGTIVPAGAEFSTLGTLGTIDNTTGYLPELVIKGDRTTPEFGGGLCQVSTTLFRSVMNAGLPVTARRNHSYRVSYYEKDGEGRVIGPGLDATIYEPNLDFKFRNDTATPVLIIGYVAGDKVTFELYGTRDGRTSTVDGPRTLTSTPPGDPEYIPEPSLAVGVTKQVEFPHPGGSAVATYTISYADGTTKTQTFTSWYRRWPAKFLVGTGGVIPTPTPSPTPAL